MPFGRRADVHELDAIGRVCDGLKVLFDLVGAGESAIGAECEAEEGFRSSWRLWGLRRERTRPEYE